jgi:hypothetical protein
MRPLIIYTFKKQACIFFALNFINKNNAAAFAKLQTYLLKKCRL